MRRRRKVREFCSFIEIYKPSEELVLQETTKRPNGIVSLGTRSEIPRSDYTKSVLKLERPTLFRTYSGLHLLLHRFFPTMQTHNLIEELT